LAQFNILKVLKSVGNLLGARGLVVPADGHLTGKAKNSPGFGIGEKSGWNDSVPQDGKRTKKDGKPESSRRARMVVDSENSTTIG
jgi:hypothetical protein